MKLAVTICAYNEADTLGSVISSVPRKLDGIDSVEIIVVDDGSSDATSAVARQAGVDVVIKNKSNQGLAYSYFIAIQTALKNGADILVHTDADNQYDQSEIYNIIKPILAEQADIAVGNRQIAKLGHMSLGKMYGNKIGSWTVSKLTSLKGIDASSGFRAMTRDAALRLNVLFGHTYTHQTLIEAAYKKLVVVSIPVIFKKREFGESRLISGVMSHIKTSLFVIIRTLLVYRPLKTFLLLGTLFELLALLVGARFVYYFFFISGTGKIQSLILVAIFAIIGIIMYTVGFIGDLIAINRRLSDEILYQSKKNSYAGQK